MSQFIHAFDPDFRRLHANAFMIDLIRQQATSLGATWEHMRSLIALTVVRAPTRGVSSVADQACWMNEVTQQD